MNDRDRVTRFETALMPHLDAAYDLARWLVRNECDAEDLVQDAYLRAFRHVDGLRGSDGRAWLLTIVRNTCYTWLRQRRVDTPRGTEPQSDVPDEDAPTPETLLLRDADRALVRAALEALPVESREVLVLRELEGLSYKEIAAVIDVPIGTVMSRLARARDRLHRELARRAPRGG